MKQRTSMVLTSLILCSSLVGNALGQTNQTSSESSDITKTIQAFWTALGTFDHEAMKQTFDWPVTIIEISETQTTNPKALASPAEFDELVKSAHRPASGRSDFFGITASGYSVLMMNNSLTHVTYKLTFPARNGKPARSLNALAILRKQAPETWKIIFITVPK